MPGGPTAGPPDPPPSLIIHILWCATRDEALKIAAKPRFLAPSHEKTKNLINYSCQPSFLIHFFFSNSLTDTHSGCFLCEISWRIKKKWTLSLKNSRTRSFSTFLTFLWKPDISFFPMKLDFDVESASENITALHYKFTEGLFVHKITIKSDIN